MQIAANTTGTNKQYENIIPNATIPKSVYTNHFFIFSLANKVLVIC